MHGENLPCRRVDRSTKKIQKEDDKIRMNKHHNNAFSYPIFDTKNLLDGEVAGYFTKLKT